MATILPRKAGVETPIATDDEHHEQLASDPTVHQFPQGSSFGSSFNSTPSFGGSNAFSTSGAPSFNSPQTPSYNSNGNFGSQSQQPQQPQQNLTASAEAAVKGGAESLVENTNTDWINKKWRPMMGWMYMVTCTADFVIFPVLWSILQAVSKGSVTQQWQPLTLQGAGLYHVAMGAVLGIAAYGRTKEKIEGAAK